MTKLYCHFSILVIFVFSNILAKAYDVTKNLNESVRFVSVVFRHGDRMLDPYEIFPNDDYPNYNDYPNGPGMLTNIGKKRAYNLGKQLKNRYSFLGDVYYQPEVFATSTSIPRTKMTLELVLAALYPPAPIQKWDQNLNWQPVDILYLPIDQDGLLFSINCPAYKLAYEELMKDPVVQKKLMEFKDLEKELTVYTGKQITNLLDVFIVYHSLATKSSLDMNLPEWSKPLFPNGKISEGAMLQYELFSYNEELIRNNGGKLLYKIINDMNEIVSGTSATHKKIDLFSAHDINVASFLFTLDIFHNYAPMFTSAVIMELHEINGSYFVKVLHYLGIPEEFVEQAIPGCEILCPYDKFILLTSMRIPKFDDSNCTAIHEVKRYTNFMTF